RQMLVAHGDESPLGQLSGCDGMQLVLAAAQSCLDRTVTVKLMRSRVAVATYTLHAEARSAPEQVTPTRGRHAYVCHLHRFPRSLWWRATAEPATWVARPARERAPRRCA